MHHDRAEREDDAPVGSGESAALVGATSDSRRQVAIADQVRGESREHETSRDAEAEVPAVDLREQPREQRPDDGTEVDRHAEDREAARAPRLVVARVEGTDLGRDIALEESRADHEQQQGEQERLLERHRQVPAGHRQRADHDGVALPDPAVGDQAAEQWREVHEARVEAEDLRRERLRRQRPDHGFDRGAKSREPDDVLDVPRQQQLVHHVEHQQRRHAVVREALPGLGEGEVEEPLRMTRETGPGRARRRRFDCAQWIAPVLPTRRRQLL